MTAPALMDTPQGLRVMVRPARSSDQAYVCSSWAINLSRAGQGAMSDARGIVDRIVDHPTTRIAVASDPGDTDRIIGWLAYSPMPAVRVVHFAFVRAVNRDKGVARALMEWAGLRDARPLVYTLRGPCAKSLLRHYPSAIVLPHEEFVNQ